LNAGQDSGDIVRGAPSVLQNVQTQLAGGVDVGVEHVRHELDARRLVGVRLLERHDEPEGAVLKGRVSWTDDDRVPVFWSTPSASNRQKNVFRDSPPCNRGMNGTEFGSGEERRGGEGRWGTDGEG
jgi:hypothetical protein